jgi:acylphosphatase
MTQTRFKGRITSLVLQSGDLAVSGNVKGIRWREKTGRVTAETVANNIQPVGWHQGHREAEVEILILGEASEILGSGTALVSNTGDNLVMTSAGVKLTNHLGSSMVVFFTSPIIDNIETGVDDFAVENMTTIRMKAYAVSLPALV